MRRQAPSEEGGELVQGRLSCSSMATLTIIDVSTHDLVFFIFILNRVSFRRKKKDEKTKDVKEDPKAKEGPKKKGAEEVRSRWQEHHCVS
jgi:hypothetical protein